MNTPANKSAKARLASKLFAGVHPGLPNKVQRVPFGLESRSREAVGLTESQLQVVVAVLAADYAQVTPVTRREIDKVVECSANASLNKLVQRGWLVEAPPMKGTQRKAYSPSAKAWRELLPDGWSLLKEVA